MTPTNPFLIAGYYNLEFFYDSKRETATHYAESHYPHRSREGDFVRRLHRHTQATRRQQCKRLIEPYQTATKVVSPPYLVLVYDRDEVGRR